MREKELIVYRNMSREEGKLLGNMSYIMDHCGEIEDKEASDRAGQMKEMFYACIHELL